MSNIILNTNYKVNVHELADEIQSVSVYKPIKNPMISFFAPQGGSVDTMYRPHVYDLYEYGRIIDTESFVARAFAKKRSLMFKGGYQLDSEDEKNAEYISKRLTEISYVSGTPFDQFIKETATNVITFHNAYLVRVRKKEASSGKPRKINGQEVEPVAAYFNLPPETVQVKVNDAGVPVYYRQYVSPGKYKEYSAKDVIHIYYNKRTGFVMGTPPLEPVKDDILALRRIEESIETLIYKSLFPIIHVKVGTEKVPAKKYPDGTSEVSIATQYLRNIEDNGGVVTSERIDIKAIGSESLALRVEGYLSHFKSRVFIGLGMSAIDFGEGDSTGRATGEVLSESLKESVMDYQSCISEFVSDKILRELLVESGKYKAEYLIPDNEMVWFTFGNLDISGKIKLESHEINKMTQGVQSVNETRKRVGLKGMTDDEIKSMNEVKAYDGKEKEAAKHAPKAAPGGAKPAGASAKKKGSSNLTKSITKPKNQHNKDSTEGRIIDVLNSQSPMKYNRVYNIIRDDINEILGEDVVDNVLKHDLVHNTALRIVNSHQKLNSNDIQDFIDSSILGLYEDFA